MSRLWGTATRTGVVAQRAEKARVRKRLNISCMLICCLENVGRELMGSVLSADINRERGWYAAQHGVYTSESWLLM